MTWIAGTSRAGYDFAGDYVARNDAHASAPHGVIGDASWPGSMQPGTFMLCEGPPRIVKVNVRTTPED